MKKIVAAFMLWLGTTALMAGGDLHLYHAPNPQGAITPESIEQSLNAHGFTTAINSEMTRPYTIQFKQTDYAVFNLLTVYHDELAEAIIKEHPDSGAVFMPMGVGIYQAKDEADIHVSILSAEGFEKIIGFKSPLIAKTVEAARAAVEAALPGAVHTMGKDAAAPEGPLLTAFDYEVDPEEWEDAKDELVMMIEDGFKPLGFVMANFTEYNYILTREGTIESPYDFYDTYSICKLKVIYEVSKTRPEAAAFAPCTMVLYKRKGSDNIRMAFPGVYNWLASAHVSDPEAVSALMKAQQDFEGILQRATE